MSFMYSFFAYLKSGETSLYFPENRINDATMVTTIGDKEKTSDIAHSDGSAVFVRITIMINEIILPMTRKEFDKATCW